MPIRKDNWITTSLFNILIKVTTCLSYNQFYLTTVCSPFTFKSGETVKNKKVTPIVSRPSEKEIREKANEIYLQRIDRGEYGTVIDDWHKAEELLRGRT